MARDVNAKRSYHSPRRLGQAEETRQSVLKAARKLFTTQGWTKTTIAGIARQASVSNETVYAVFGSKRAILRTLVEHAVRGAARDVPLSIQPGPRAVRRETDQRRQIALFAADIATILNRVAPLMSVMRAAAETEHDIAGLYATLHRGRRKNLELVTDALLARGPLRRDIDRDEATRIIWRLASPELFLLMRQVEGLSTDAYRLWLAESLSRLLIDPKD